MAILTEGNRKAEYLISEATDWRSRDEATVDATGGALEAGTVLGKVTATGKYVAHNTGLTNGAEVAAAILFEGIGAEEADRTITARDAEVNGNVIIHMVGITANDKTAAIAALAANGIIVR